MNMQVGSTAVPPPWGYDSGIKNDEATFQVAMLLGNLASYIDRFFKANPGDPEKDQEVKEMERLKDLINKYLGEGKVDPPVKDLAKALMAQIGNLENQTKIENYQHLYQSSPHAGSPTFGQQLYNWAFPSGGKMPYTITRDTNSDTKAAIYLFLNSLPDAATKLEALFSKDGMLGNFGEESRTFLAAWIASHKKDMIAYGENFDLFIQDFSKIVGDSDTDPNNKTFDVHQFVNGLNVDFVQYLFGNLSDAEIAQKLKLLSDHISLGFDGTDAAQASPSRYGDASARVEEPHSPLPSSGGLDSLLPGGDQGELSEGSDPYYDKLLNFITYLGHEGTDPAALASFEDYIAHLINANKLDNRMIAMLNELRVASQA